MALQTFDIVFSGRISIPWTNLLTYYTVWY